MPRTSEPVTREEFHQELNALKAEILRAIDERAERTETKLLTAFHGWARAMEIRQRSTSTAVCGFDERLALLEERVSRIERGDTPR